MLFFAIFMGYSNINFATTSSKTNVDFDTYKKIFTERLWKIYPEWASSVGYHKYDANLVVPNKTNRDKELFFCKRGINKIEKILAR